MNRILLFMDSLVLGIQKRERGNLWFSRSEFTLAIQCYRKAAEYLDDKQIEEDMEAGDENTKHETNSAATGANRSIPPSKGTSGLVGAQGQDFQQHGSGEWGSYSYLIILGECTKLPLVEQMVVVCFPMHIPV